MARCRDLIAPLPAGKKSFCAVRPRYHSSSSGERSQASRAILSSSSSGGQPASATAAGTQPPGSQAQPAASHGRGSSQPLLGLTRSIEPQPEAEAKQQPARQQILWCRDAHRRRRGVRCQGTPCPTSRAPCRTLPPPAARTPSCPREGRPRSSGCARQRSSSCTCNNGEGQARPAAGDGLVRCVCVRSLTQQNCSSSGQARPKVRQSSAALPRALRE